VPESVGSQEPTEAARENDPFADVDVDALFANYLHDTPRTAATWEDEEEAPLENSPEREASLFDALCTSSASRSRTRRSSRWPSS